MAARSVRELLVAPDGLRRWWRRRKLDGWVEDGVCRAASFYSRRPEISDMLHWEMETRV
jgi:hypothetical protein